MISFKEEKRGYSKEQVEAYIKGLNSEYVKLTEDYQKLLEELEGEKSDNSHKDAIASAFIKAEVSGKQIIADAKAEAERIICGVNCEIERIEQIRQGVLDEIKNLSGKLHEVLNEEEQTGEQTEEQAKELVEERTQV